jgi:hypothetical protein
MIDRPACYNQIDITEFTKRPSSHASRTLIPSGPPCNTT